MLGRVFLSSHVKLYTCGDVFVNQLSGILRSNKPRELEVTWADKLDP